MGASGSATWGKSRSRGRPRVTGSSAAKSFRRRSSRTLSGRSAARGGRASCGMAGNRRFRISDMVEKPKSSAPSRYAIIGRYILPPSIFPHLERTQRGAGGEIQLTDALHKLVSEGEFYGYVFEGRRYDAGEKLGYLKATVDYALRHPALSAEFRAYLESRIEAPVAKP